MSSFQGALIRVVLSHSLLHISLSPPPLPPSSGNVALPVYVSPQFTFSEGGGKFTIRVGPKQNMGKVVHTILHFTLPSYNCTIVWTRWRMLSSPSQCLPVLPMSIQLAHVSSDVHCGSVVSSVLSLSTDGMPGYDPVARTVIWNVRYTHTIISPCLPSLLVVSMLC